MGALGKPPKARGIERDYYTTEMFPIYTCKNEELSKKLKGATPGKIVKVAFENQSNLSGPIIVDTTDLPPLTATAKEKLLGAFQNATVLSTVGAEWNKGTNPSTAASRNLPNGTGIWNVDMERRIRDIVATYETGSENNYFAMSVEQLGGIAYGRFQAQSRVIKDGNYSPLKKIIDKYYELGGKDQTMKNWKVGGIMDVSVQRSLHIAGRTDPTMQRAQDLVFDDLYFSKARAELSTLGLTKNSDLLCAYNMVIHYGVTTGMSVIRKRGTLGAIQWAMQHNPYRGKERVFHVWRYSTLADIVQNNPTLNRVVRLKWNSWRSVKEL